TRGRRPPRTLRRTLHGGVRPVVADDLPRPVTRDRELHAHQRADDVLQRMDGIRTAGPRRWTTLGDLRRSLAPHVPPRPATAHGRALAAGAALRDREHAHLPQTERPRQRRRRRLRDALARELVA